MAITNADGSIVLTTKVDQSGLKKGMTTMKSGVSSLIGSFGKLAKAIGIAFSVGVLVKFSKEASNTATTAEASVQRLIDIYGSASQAVGDFIDANARALGMSRAAAASYASVYGNLFSVWADQQTNAELTTQYLNMTAVVASKTGRTVEDVQERIRSGLLGNTEAIEDLGVFVNVKTIEMTDAFQRMASGKSWEQLDAYTQQQIRSMAILEQATAKYGNEVAQTSALTKSRFRAAWEDFQATWGQVVNRILVPALDVLTDILVTSTAVLQSIFNISSSTISQGELIDGAKENQDELTDSVKETEKAAKRLLAPFDEINAIASESNDGFSLIDQPTINIPTFKYEKKKELEQVRGIIDSIKSGLDELSGAFSGFSKIDISNLDGPLSRLADSSKELAGVSWGIIKDAITHIFTPLASFTIEDLLPRFIDTLTNSMKGLKTILDEGWKTFMQLKEDFLDPIWAYAEPKILEYLDKLNDRFGKLIDKIEKSEAWQDFRDILSSIGKMLEPIVKDIIDFLDPINHFVMNSAFNLLETVLDDIGDSLGLIAALLKFDIPDAWEHIKNLLYHNRVEDRKRRQETGKDLWGKIDFGSAADLANLMGWGNLGFSLDIIDVLRKLKGASKLANGAVIPGGREFFAILGDQPRGQTNIEAPLDTIKQAVGDVLMQMGYVGGSSAGKVEVPVYLDGREIARAIRNAESEMGTQTVFGGFANAY